MKTPNSGNQNDINSGEEVSRINYCEHTGLNADAQCRDPDRSQKERSRKVKLVPGEHVRIVLSKAKGGASLVGVTVIYDTAVIHDLFISVEPDAV